MGSFFDTKAKENTGEVMPKKQELTWNNIGERGLPDDMNGLYIVRGKECYSLAVLHQQRGGGRFMTATTENGKGVWFTTLDTNCYWAKIGERS